MTYEEEMRRPVLSDETLERILVRSAARMFDAGPSRLIDIVSSDEMEYVTTRRIWRAIEESVAERGFVTGPEDLIRRAGVTEAEWQRLSAAVEPVWSFPEAVRIAGQVADMSAYRKIQMLGSGLLNQVLMGVPVEDIVRSTLDHLQSVRAVVPELVASRSLRTIMESTEIESFDWAVPNWLEHRDRVMITGREGGGKTSLLRQLCIQLAIGFHPWTGERFRPLRVLMIDLQDGRVRNEREFRWIAEKARVDPTDQLLVESWDGGLNVVSSIADRRRLEGLIRGTRPEVVALGPIYRMAIGEDATDAAAMQRLIDVIDTSRSRYDVTWLLEAHSPKASAQSRGQRSWEPFGSQRFMAWPDAGVGLQPDSKNAQAAKFISWRGNRDRGSKIWPGEVRWGEKWPWVPKEVVHGDLALSKAVPQPASEQMSGEYEGEEEPFA